MADRISNGGAAGHWNTPVATSAASITVIAANEPLQRSSAKSRLNVRACEMCRKMKVKCDGFDNPPCVRCRKSGRGCLFQPLPQGRDKDSEITSRKRPRRADLPTTENEQSPAPRSVIQNDVPIEQLSNAQPYVANHTLPASNTEFEGSHVEQPGEAVAVRNDVGMFVVRRPSNFAPYHAGVDPDLPSVYSTSPLDAVNVPDVGDARTQYHTAEERAKVARQGQETLLSFTASPFSTTPDDNIRIPKRDLRGMIKIFCEKLLPTIPLFSPQNFQDADHLIETDFSLVCCICYVTARFLPGGKQLRVMLMPSVARILEGRFTGSRSQVDELSTLKRLIILYSYANTSSPSPQESEMTRPEELLYWPLKSLVEVYALRLSLHRSIYDLQAELRSPTSRSITETIAYQKYTFWLQLFALAKYASVVSGTPPSIPIDSTIRAAPLLMEEIGMNPQADLFGQVELSIIWEKVGNHRQLGEWWCPRDPSKVINDQETESLLREADHLIDIWYAKWSNYMNNEEGSGGILDYHGRCTRFWINSYATRNLQYSSAGLTPIQKEQVRTCVIYASRVLDWPLDLSPFQKESLRYVPESASIMVSFCSLFIIASCQTFGSTLTDLYLYLDRVIIAAQLMLDIAPDKEHNTYAHGLLILKKASALQKRPGVLEADRDVSNAPMGVTESNLTSGLTGEESLGQFQQFNLQDDGMAPMDSFWDFSILTPRIW